MIITKRHIPRRTFLRGAGVTLALPLLDCMLPAQTPQRQTAAAGGSIKRFVGVWHPHGASPGYWSPLQEGQDFEFSYITKPLEPFRDSLVVISNLVNVSNDHPGYDNQPAFFPDGSLVYTTQSGELTDNGLGVHAVPGEHTVVKTQSLIERK